MTRGVVLRNIMENQAVGDKFFKRAFVADAVLWVPTARPEEAGLERLGERADERPGQHLAGRLQALDLRVRFANRISPTLRTLMRNDLKTVVLFVPFCGCLRSGGS